MEKLDVKTLAYLMIILICYNIGTIGEAFLSNQSLNTIQYCFIACLISMNLLHSVIIYFVIREKSTVKLCFYKTMIVLNILFFIVTNIVLSDVKQIASMPTFPLAGQFSLLLGIYYEKVQEIKKGDI